MKISEILEMDDMEDRPVKKLSPEMEKRKQADQDKIRAERNWNSRSGGSRLRGRGRGTRQADQSMIQK